VDDLIFLSFFFGANLILWVGFFWGVFNFLKRASYLGEIFGHEWYIEGLRSVVPSGQHGFGQM
jgi:hypothetical protein